MDQEPPNRRDALVTWNPEWSVPDMPCEEPDVCTPEHPTCDACIAGRHAMMADGIGSIVWAHLTEFARDAWRREAADA
jgi:hypothetical protein